MAQGDVDVFKPLDDECVLAVSYDWMLLTGGQGRVSKSGLLDLKH